MTQLALNIPPYPDTFFEHFVWQKNTLLRDLLFDSLSFSPTSEKMFYLWGETGCGKSHLLQASCHFLGQQGHACAYLPLKEFIHTDPAILDNLEQLHLIAIDDLDLLAGNAAWEEALFHCYNRIAASQNSTRLIMASSMPLASLSIQLPDLQSRLSACMIFQLIALNDETYLDLLRDRATQRGLQLPEDVGQFLIQRAPRNPGQLLALFEQLDHAAWTEKHRLTIPFVKKILDL